jgi:hypothetical protein
MSPIILVLTKTILRRQLSLEHMKKKLLQSTNRTLPASYQGPRKFVFSKNTTIGFNDAIQDKEYLKETFIDNGVLESVLDTKNPKSIIIGRTGSGKTALLNELETRSERLNRLYPEDLAINYLSNNEFLQFFSSSGLNLDMFYKLLWRHILIVEIIKMHYQITDELTQKSFLNSFFNLFSKNKAKTEALKYLIDWGKEFWKESDYRIKEITKKLEDDVTTAIEAEGKINVPILKDVSGKFTLSRAKRASSEEKGEFVRIGQKIVDAVQIKQLANVIDFLSSDVFNNQQKKYFISIDHLDENWVDEKLRYPVLKALIETVKFINERISNVKIVIALREDLINRVFFAAKDPTLQFEKYKDMYVNVYWSENELQEVLVKRVEKLLKDQKASNVSKLDDLINISKKFNPVEYIVKLTLLRPRDLIMFFNECIIASHGKSKLTKESILSAEDYYSENRLRALYDEWKIDYPNLLIIIYFYKGFPPSFSFNEFKNSIDISCQDFLTSSNIEEDYLYFFIKEKHQNGHLNTIIIELIKILHKVGIVGVRNKNSKTIWCFQRPISNEIEINEDSTFFIHPAFHRALTIKNT